MSCSCHVVRSQQVTGSTQGACSNSIIVNLSLRVAIAAVGFTNSSGQSTADTLDSRSIAYFCTTPATWLWTIAESVDSAMLHTCV